MISKRIYLKVCARCSTLQLCVRKRTYSTKAKLAVALDETVSSNIEKEVIKPRTHPGIFKPKTVIIPDVIIKSIERSAEDHSIKTLLNESQKLRNHLKGRVPSMEQLEIEDLRTRVQKRVEEKVLSNPANEGKDEEILNQSIKDKVINILKQKVYHWTPINYDEQTSLVYLVGRFAPEYAVLTKIFGEIVQRDPEFKPRSLLDFGSGVGTVTWAARQYWQKHLFEYFNVDSSSCMNDLALKLLQEGRDNKAPVIKGVFHRQFLPATKRPYDLVVSAYSLLELPNLQSRIETIVNLWNKTDKYLVIVEQGTNGGFRVINQIRDFILQKKNNRGHVFSPCPHDNVCPRYVSDDGTPCNFQINYFSLPLGAKSELQRELYSYVVLKKGDRNSEELQWPRVVRPCLVRSRHTVCRMCTPTGKLEEIIVTAAKHGKTIYHCARSTQWGDLLPIKIEKSNTTG